MANQVTKRCHWVSQSYLRAFAADPDRKKIWRFSKTEGEPELKRIDKVAVKHHLYAPMGADGKRNDALEKKLADLENWFGEPIWAAVCNDFPDLTWEPLRKMIALLVTTTYVRNPTHFELWKKVHHQLKTQLSQYDELPSHMTIGETTTELDHSEWPAFRDPTEEDLKASWNDYVGSAGDIARMLLKMRWAVVFADDPVFITSDNPVQITHPSLKFRGLNNPESILSFPLSPTRMLMMDHRHKEPNGAYYPLRHDPASENVLTWRNAINHMFSPRDPHVVCAEMLADAERMGVA